MKLLHYTAQRYADGIRESGITLGSLVLPAATGLVQIRPLQWLTDDENWQGQGWAVNHLGDWGDRTVLRFRVVIPKAHRKNLYWWPYFATDVLKMRAEDERVFAKAGGGNGTHWWVYKGRIPPGWLRGVEYRDPGYREPAKYDPPVKSIGWVP